MLAKLIAFAQTRRDALEKLGRALDDTSIFGLTTNQAFLKLIELPATRSVTIYAGLIDERLGELSDATLLAVERRWLAASRRQ